MPTNLASLANKLSLKFKNSHLVENAFVHRSFLNESSKFSESNERLEYLGDAVLELATSDYLYKKYPSFQEGMLTNLRASLVRTESLALMAQELGLEEHIQMSRGEEATGGRSNISILANTTEAFLGAIYLDLGFPPCIKLLESYLFPHLSAILEDETYKDNKSHMQEIAQARFKQTPRYDLLSETGPDHDKVFTVVATIGSKKYGVGKGNSKQAAQEAAAKATLEILDHT
ncbi:MAG: ribonuclease III [bacterium]